METRIISYEEYEALVKLLTAMVKNQFQDIDFVFSPPRGGWPIAVHLSHHLGVPILTPADLPACALPVGMKFPEVNRVLFVDDIVDSGRTLIQFKMLMEKKIACGWNIQPLSAALCRKAHATIQPDLWAITVPDNAWVVFPWENMVNIKKDKTLYEKRKEL